MKFYVLTRFITDYLVLRRDCLNFFRSENRSVETLTFLNLIYRPLVPLGTIFWNLNILLKILFLILKIKASIRFNIKTVLSFY